MHLKLLTNVSWHPYYWVHVCVIVPGHPMLLLEMAAEVGRGIASPHFRLEGHGPSRFFTILLIVKDTPVKITMFNSIKNSAFSNKLQLLMGTHLPQTSPASRKHDGWHERTIFDFNKLPPILKIVPPAREWQSFQQHFDKTYTECSNHFDTVCDCKHQRVYKYHG